MWIKGEKFRHFDENVGRSFNCSFLASCTQETIPENSKCHEYMRLFGLFHNRVLEWMLSLQDELVVPWNNILEYRRAA